MAQLIRLSFLMLSWGNLFASAGQATVAEKTVAFVFFGDFGTGAPPQMKVAKAIKEFCTLKERCDFLLTLGDNIYGSGASSAQDPRLKERIDVPYAPIGIPMYGVLGNHDWDGDPQAEIDYTQLSSIWRLPAFYYSFASGPAEFFALDTTPALSGEQRNWLSERLSASGEEWKIVFGHHPIVSYGHHGADSTNAPLMREMFRNRADFYFAGHEHDKQVIVGASDDPIFVISGAAAKTRPTARGRGTRFAASTLGFGYFRAQGSQAEISFYSDSGLKEYSLKIIKKNGRATIQE